MNMEVINDLRVKNEPIWEDNPISDSKQDKHKRQSILSTKVKEEPKDSEMQTSNSQIEVKSEEEEKFSAIKEFADDKTSIQTISIAFLNEESIQTINSKPNKLQNSK